MSVAPLHGNSGYQIKNLKKTSGCKHYSDHAASADDKTKCAANGCAEKAIRACHIISANQNTQTGLRKIVYMCPSHNGSYQTHTIRANAYTVVLEDCDCGYDPCQATKGDGKACGHPTPCGYHS